MNRFTLQSRLATPLDAAMITRRLALLNARLPLPEGLAAGGFAYEVVASAGAQGFTPPDWIQLTPRGAVTARDGRSFVFHPETLVERFNADGLKLPLDFEHESDFTALLGARPARGWIVALEARVDGTFGKVEWNVDAVQALEARHYRYISPTVWLEPDEKTGSRLKGAALVASPAVSMPALASTTPSSGRSTMLKDILAQLGLTENATLDEAKGALARLSAVDPAKYAPAAQLTAAQGEVARLSGEIKALKEEAEARARAELVDSAIEAGKLAPASREQYLALASADIALTKAAIDAMPVILAAGSNPKLDKADPARGARGKVSDEERSVIARLGLSEEAYLATRDAV